MPIGWKSSPRPPKPPVKYDHRLRHRDYIFCGGRPLQLIVNNGPQIVPCKRPGPMKCKLSNGDVFAVGSMAYELMLTESGGVLLFEKGKAE